MKPLNIFDMIEKKKSQLTDSLSAFYAVQLKEKFPFIPAELVGRFSGYMSDLTLLVNGSLENDALEDKLNKEFDHKRNEMKPVINQGAVTLEEQNERFELFRQILEQGDEVLARFCDDVLLEELTNTITEGLDAPDGSVCIVEMGVFDSNGNVEVIHSEVKQPTHRSHTLH